MGIFINVFFGFTSGNICCRMVQKHMPPAFKKSTYTLLTLYTFRSLSQKLEEPKSSIGFR